MNEPTYPLPRTAQTRSCSGLPVAWRGQRVVPLPIAVAAVLVPFLTVWAAAQAPEQASARVIQGAGAEARPLDEPFVFLGRDVRVPDDDGGYVDVWAVPAGWEAGLLQRRGAVPTGQSMSPPMDQRSQ
ncbi:hypothetical protein Poly30_32160 [Planctomycetes bacterium Poly30]|uniref:Uncharacterized protein n=1 Tax=Saltatorellus ferox TaxID=2528018 RepID=A0A518EUA7_9BACT|nr:hypothetical protein Poly30_32160 [Planctomycetes bacterium Poly30]